MNEIWHEVTSSKVHRPTNPMTTSSSCTTSSLTYIILLRFTGYDDIIIEQVYKSN